MALPDYYVLTLHGKLLFQTLLVGVFIVSRFCNPTTLFQIPHPHRLLGSAEIVFLRIDLVNWREKPMFGSASKTRTLAGTLG
jgi:hypothetical protein